MMGVVIVVVMKKVATFLVILVLCAGAIPLYAYAEKDATQEGGLISFFKFLSNTFGLTKSGPTGFVPQNGAGGGGDGGGTDDDDILDELEACKGNIICESKVLKKHGIGSKTPKEPDENGGGGDEKDNMPNIPRAEQCTRRATRDCIADNGCRGQQICNRGFWSRCSTNLLRCPDGTCRTDCESGLGKTSESKEKCEWRLIVENSAACPDELDAENCDLYIGISIGVCGKNDCNGLFINTINGMCWVPHGAEPEFGFYCEQSCSEMCRVLESDTIHVLDSVCVKDECKCVIEVTLTTGFAGIFFPSQESQIKEAAGMIQEKTTEDSMTATPEKRCSDYDGYCSWTPCESGEKNMGQLDCAIAQVCCATK